MLKLTTKTLAFLTLCLAPFTAYAQTGTFNFTTVGGTGTGYTWDGMMVLTINNNADVEITGTATGGRRIEIAKNATAKITLNGLSITGLSSGQAPLLLNDGAKLTLTLVGESVLTAGSNRAGVEAPDGTTLEINGEGSLKVTGSTDCAGIGGGKGNSGGKITISGGTVTANGGYEGAGIGGGSSGTGGTIIIIGGTVTASGSSGSAGIGGGYKGDGGEITISGGTVTAKGGSSSGIGGGNGGNGGEIKISGGTVTANGKVGIDGYNGKITISGGTVSATGSSDAGIGGKGSKITIIGGTVTADGNGAGIGGYDGANGDEITISGGTVSAKGYWGAGIGGGDRGNGGKITISGGAVTATNTHQGAGIGGGCNGAGGTIIISGGTVTANRSGIIMSSYGAGIGNGDYGESGTLIMNNENGGALVFASSVSDMSGKSSGILVIGNTTYWFGGNEFILSQNAEVPANYTLTILSGKTLTVKQNATLTVAKKATLVIPAGITLTNNGTIIPADSSTINVEGTLKGNKITGANASVPKLSSKTVTSITLNASTILATTGQTNVEYAINTSNSVPTSGWQTSTTFSNLKSGTDYYLFARSVGNANFTDGNASNASWDCTEDIINSGSDYCIFGPRYGNICAETTKEVCDVADGTMYPGGSGGGLLVRTDGSTPIRLPQTTSRNIIAKSIGNNIVLENLPTNAKVEIYNLQGKRISSVNSENSKILRILVQTKGIYIIKAGHQTMRIAVK